MKKILLTGCFLLACLAALGQHPPMFSQYMFNGLAINPAYTGSRDALSATALYRHQWAGLVGAPRTQNFSLHSPTRNGRNNFGLNLMHDRLGISSHSMAYGTYAMRIDMGEKAGRLAFGLQGGVSLLQDRWTEVVTGSPGDYIFGADSPTFLVPRFGFGLYWDHAKWYAGLSSPFLIDIKNTSYSTYIQNSISYRPFIATAGCVFRLNPDLVLKPSVLYKHLSASPDQLDLNMNLVIKDALWLGGSFRTGDGIVAMLEYQINPQFRFGYSFDYATTALQRYNGGSHELMLRYEFGYQLKGMNPRYF